MELMIYVIMLEELLYNRFKQNKKGFENILVGRRIICKRMRYIHMRKNMIMMEYR